MPFKSYLSNRIRIHNTPSYQHRYRRHGASQKNQSALAFASKISLLTVLQGCRRFNILIDKTSSSSDSWLIFIHPIYWTYCMHRNTASPCQSRISSASSDYRGLRWLSATRHLWASSHSSRILSSTWGQTGKATFAWKKNKSQLTMATALVNWRKGILRSEKKAREREHQLLLNYKKPLEISTLLLYKVRLTYSPRQSGDEANDHLNENEIKLKKEICLTGIRLSVPFMFRLMIVMANVTPRQTSP